MGWVDEIQMGISRISRFNRAKQMEMAGPDELEYKRKEA